MNRLSLGVAFGAAALLPAALGGCAGWGGPSVESAAEPHVAAANPVEAGRYLVTIGNCNDCHTERFMEVGEAIPERERLTGSSLGWKGPWGTTYGSNLRLKVQEYSEDDWVTVLHTRKAKPPMPWPGVNRLSDQDARAIYQYLRSLGPLGSPVPEYVPPQEQPRTPYLMMEPQGMLPPSN